MSRYKIVKDNGKFKREHRLVWERAYGKIPKGYIIHHINGNSKDNRLENLLCLSHGDHIRLHSMLRSEGVDPVDSQDKDVINDRTYAREYNKRHRSDIAKRTKLYRATHRDEIALSKLIYRIAHCEEINVYQKQYRSLHADEISSCKKLWYAKNKDAVLKRRKEYAQRNTEAIKSYQQVYRDTHKDSASEYSKRYRSEHNDELRVKQKIYRDAHKEEIALGKKICYAVKKGLPQYEIDNMRAKLAAMRKTND